MRCRLPKATEKFNKENLLACSFSKYIQHSLCVGTNQSDITEQGKPLDFPTANGGQSLRTGLGVYANEVTGRGAFHTR